MREGGRALGRLPENSLLLNALQNGSQAEKVRVNFLKSCRCTKEEGTLNLTRHCLLPFTVFFCVVVVGVRVIDREVWLAAVIRRDGETEMVPNSELLDERGSAKLRKPP